MIVIVTVLILAVLLKPRMGARGKHVRIACVGNLKNIGLAFRIFATDHGGKYPTGLSVTNGGTREWQPDDAQLWRHWAALSNELSLPKLLLCPADKARQPAKPFWGDPLPTTWSGFTNSSRLSYFLGLGGWENQPQSILAGDRNLALGTNPLAPGRLLVTTNLVSREAFFDGGGLGFTAEIHRSAGNILLGDGSVQQVTSGRLLELVGDSLGTNGLKTNVWLVP